MSEELSTAVSVSHKIKVHPQGYEMAEVFTSISGVTASSTPDDIDEMLDQATIVYTKIIERLRLKTKQIRDGELDA